jgi:hypothetical protein
MKAQFWLIGVLLVGAASVGGQDRLTMRVSPSVAFEPANLVIRMRIERNEDNRAVEIEADSSYFYRSSEIQLDGERAPRTTRFEFRSLPGGNYNITARLKGSGGEELAVVRSKVNVMASGAEH